MPRGVAASAPFHTITRTKTFKRSGARYRLAFRWEEGASKIHVNFIGHHPHDDIGVYDHATGKVTITTKAEMRAAVDEYMKDADEHDLKAHFQNLRRDQ